MKYKSTFFSCFDCYFKKIIQKTFFILKRKKAFLIKTVFSMLLCLSLSGDTTMSKNIFEGWVRPVENINLTETQKIPLEETSELFWESLRGDVTDETSFDIADDGPRVTVGKKQGFVGEARELYALALTTSVDLEGLLLSVSVDGGEIYAVIPEEMTVDCEIHDLIRGDKAAVMLLGNIVAEEREKTLFYISVTKTGDTEILPTAVLLDYVKKEKNITKSY